MRSIFISVMNLTCNPSDALTQKIDILMPKGNISICGNPRKTSSSRSGNLQACPHTSCNSSKMYFVNCTNPRQKLTAKMTNRRIG
jgi:hypothetical protein